MAEVPQNYLKKLQQQKDVSAYTPPTTSGYVSGTGDGQSAYNGLIANYNQYKPEIDKYIQELMDFAKDDYDFAAKWIEEQFTKAMGSDDAQKKEFLKSVANGLEEKVGRIQFDYQTNKYRLQGKTDLALQRLAEDERVMIEDHNIQSQLEREQQASNLNQRGIISGTRENATGLAGMNVGRLENNIGNRMEALKRSVGRSRADINLASAQGQEDIATEARRRSIDTGDQYDYDIERLQRERKRRELEAEQARKTYEWGLNNAITGNTGSFS